MFRVAMSMALLLMAASSVFGQFGSSSYSPQPFKSSFPPAPVYGQPNVYGGMNYSNGVMSQPNVYGGMNYSNGVMTQPNVYGGMNYSNGVTSQPNVYGGMNYSNGMVSRPNVFGGSDLYRGGSRVGSSQPSPTGTRWSWFSW